ncbi:MerR family transcriptional regulator [Aquicoccus sp. G2-2]|uniref:MerR family transcriptional regulator n=1 Tax=Aquicoccus sp. G2-2 TaxID=3092120 RepID=UPI00366E9BCB
MADWLGSPAHVLRFWESKFSQVKPVKRAGGRRYYRPADMLLLGGIKKLLHDDGMTIKGVQKILREQGVKHVSSLSQALDFEAGDILDNDATETQLSAQPPADAPATVLNFLRSGDRTETAPDAEKAAAKSAPDAIPESSPAGSSPPPDMHVSEPPTLDNAPEDMSAPAARSSESTETPVTTEPDTDAEPRTDTEDNAADGAPSPAELPAFLHSPTFPAAAPEAEAAAPPLRPAQIDLPPDPADDAFDVPQGILSAIVARKGNPISSPARAEVQTLMARLAVLHQRQHSAPPNKPGGADFPLAPARKTVM